MSAAAHAVPASLVRSASDSAGPRGSPRLRRRRYQSPQLLGQLTAQRGRRQGRQARHGGAGRGLLQQRCQRDTRVECPQQLAVSPEGRQIVRPLACKARCRRQQAGNTAWASPGTARQPAAPAQHLARERLGRTLSCMGTVPCCSAHSSAHSSAHATDQCIPNPPLSPPPDPRAPTHPGSLAAFGCQATAARSAAAPPPPAGWHAQRGPCRPPRRSAAVWSWVPTGLPNRPPRTPSCSVLRGKRQGRDRRRAGRRLGWVQRRESRGHSGIGTAQATRQLRVRLSDAQPSGRGATGCAPAPPCRRGRRGACRGLLRVARTRQRGTPFQQGLHSRQVAVAGCQVQRGQARAVPPIDVAAGRQERGQGGGERGAVGRRQLQLRDPAQGELSRLAAALGRAAWGGLPAARRHVGPRLWHVSAGTFQPQRMNVTHVWRIMQASQPTQAQKACTGHCGATTAINRHTQHSGVTSAPSAASALGARPWRQPIRDAERHVDRGVDTGQPGGPLLTGGGPGCPGCARPSAASAAAAAAAAFPHQPAAQTRPPKARRLPLPSRARLRHAGRAEGSGCKRSEAHIWFVPSPRVGTELRGAISGRQVRRSVSTAAGRPAVPAESRSSQRFAPSPAVAHCKQQPPAPTGIVQAGALLKVVEQRGVGPRLQQQAHAVGGAGAAGQHERRLAVHVLLVHLRACSGRGWGQAARVDAQAAEQARRRMPSRILNATNHSST